ncbi:sulfotransferase 1C4-like [Hyposmocoma kahamanoa]|uniref:sulfotransferase 1C4-like n=1 Tax=Hyposmocoma kahamanoa TaxID=1477025 RepID=UPI000E6D6A8F|nr:sulfotransferase 1C4-like [Hyposmocoma kahamanoa]
MTSGAVHACSFILYHLTRITRVVFGAPEASGFRPTLSFSMAKPTARVALNGTTWTQELVWLITNDLNFEKAKSVPLMDRYSFLEMCMFANNKAFQFLMKKNADKPGGAQILEKLSIPGYETLANMKSHRFIKTHLPMSLRPPNLLDTCKVVYVARDPRDVAVSYYCFNKENVLLGLTAPFKDFFELLKKDLLLWCPYFEHVKEAWAQRRHPNMLFLFYEDLSKELKGTARRVANFFGKSYSEEQLDQLCDFLSFDNFKKNESVDLKELRDVGMFDAQNKNFIRKGKSGGWREYFEGELALEVQNWIDQNLRDTDLRFPSL